MKKYALAFGFCGAVAAMALGLWAADLTWTDGEAGDSNWSSPNNWNPAQIPTAADVVHFTNTVVGTSVVDQDFAINGLTYDNATGRHVTVIGDGVVLTVSNYLRVGRSAPATSAVRITGAGGTLRMSGDIQVSGTNTGSLVMD